MFRLAAAVSALALLSTAAVAEPGVGFQSTGTPEPATNATTTADQTGDRDPNKIICKNVKPPTGTRIGSSRNRQRICQTRADWEQQELEAQAAARGARNGMNSSPSENAPPSH